MSELEETLERLYGLIPKGKGLGLERIQAACDHFGNPEKQYPVVHVAGTNGKGSVCAFADAMLRASGEKVGLYTSPHLTRFAERIQIDGEPIADDKLVPLLQRVMDEAPDLTFFEVATMTALLAFSEAEVDIAILEVGLGGRLDATNVVPAPKVAALTRIAFDHQKELGSSLGEIAREKVAIIKEKSKVVLGKLHPDARAEVEKRCEEVGAEVVELASPEPVPGAQIAYPRLAMFGSNLAVAVTIARELGVDPEVMARGIENTVWPARNELLHRNGQELTLLDCAHNPDGAVALSHVLDPSLLGEIESRREVALVFGTLETKNWRAMLDRLEHVVGHRVYVKPSVARALDPKLMADQVKGEICESVGDALARARGLVGPRGVVVVTGSIFLAGEARALLLGLPVDPPVDL